MRVTRYDAVARNNRSETGAAVRQRRPSCSSPSRSPCTWCFRKRRRAARLSRKRRRARRSCRRGRAPRRRARDPRRRGARSRCAIRRKRCAASQHALEATRHRNSFRTLRRVTMSTSSRSSRARARPIDTLRETVFDVELVGAYGDMVAYLRRVRVELEPLVVRELSLMPLDECCGARRSMRCSLRRLSGKTR